MINKLLEPDLKLIVLSYLIESGFLNRGDTILNEFTTGSSSRRVDLAVIRKETLYAFELKSDGDTLARLDGQIKKDEYFFDKVIIVASSRHIMKAKDVIPPMVGLWEINKGKIKIKQRGKVSYIKDKEAFIKLMTANELFKLAKSEGLAVTIQRRMVLEELLVSLSLSKLRKAAIRSIKNRYQMTSNAFFDKAISVGVDISDIELLSLFQKERKDRLDGERKKKEQWDQFREGNLNDPMLEKLAKTKSYNVFGDVPRSIKKLIDN